MINSKVKPIQILLLLGLLPSAFAQQQQLSIWDIGDSGSGNGSAATSTCLSDLAPSPNRAHTRSSSLIETLDLDCPHPSNLNRDAKIVVIRAQLYPERLLASQVGATSEFDKIFRLSHWGGFLCHPPSIRICKIR